ncbi:MAG: branched-chain amino acid transporter permease [Ilumatobacteraceae bacterium]|nr:branched-chain amino acid transporter permease [Ilumatobacteraceae bacterium]
MISLRDPRVRPVATTSITLGIAVGIFAILFGVGAVDAGASTAQACAMSLLVFTGASQLSAVAVIAGGGSVGSALGGALVLAARNGVFGLTMSRRLTGRLPTRLLAAQLTIDESTAMATAQTDPDLQRAAFWITGVSIYVFWNLGTLVGALAGNAIDPKKFGLDAAIPSAFVAVLWPHTRTRRGRRAMALGAALCLVSIPFVPIGVPVLISATAILIAIPPPGPDDAPSDEHVTGELPA